MQRCHNDVSVRKENNYANITFWNRCCLTLKQIILAIRMWSCTDAHLLPFCKEVWQQIWDEVVVLIPVSSSVHFWVKQWKNIWKLANICRRYGECVYCRWYSVQLDQGRCGQFVFCEHTHVIWWYLIFFQHLVIFTMQHCCKALSVYYIHYLLKWQKHVTLFLVV